MLRNIFVSALVALVVGLGVAAWSIDKIKLGGSVVTNPETHVNGLTVQNGLTISSGTLTAGALSASGDATVGGGTLNVTTSNTATSTVVAGCFQFYATSTATALKFQASTTPGAMYSQYGACPNA